MPFPIFSVVESFTLDQYWFAAREKDYAKIISQDLDEKLAIIVEPDNLARDFKLELEVSLLHRFRRRFVAMQEGFPIEFTISYPIVANLNSLFFAPVVVILYSH